MTTGLSSSFVMGLLPLNGHHNDREGNLRHSVEVAERALALAAGDPAVCEEAISPCGASSMQEKPMNTASIIVGLCLRSRASDRACTTVIEWVAAACAKHNADIPMITGWH